MAESFSNSVLLIQIVVFVVCLFFRAIFSFLETSIAALRLFKLKELATSAEVRYDALLKALEKTPHRVLITVLIANNLSDVTLSALATQITQQIFAHLHLSSGLGFGAGIVVATVTILIFGEIIPKNLARGKGERFFPSLLWIANGVFYLFYPVASLLLRVTNAIARFFSGGYELEATSEWVSSEREIQFLIDYIFEKGLIEEEKTEMLQNVFELGRISVQDIMLPAEDIVSVPSKLTIKEVLAIFQEHQFSRLPVWRDSKDNVIGMIHLKDIFAALVSSPDRPIKELVRPILFVPESVKVNQLLREFKQQHVHIALVLNEHGIVAGLITLEDVLEEIVGEINDEHETRFNHKISLIKKNNWLVDASTSLSELGATLNITFDTAALTLGGFMAEQLQHIPQKDESFHYKNYLFTVQRATERRVIQVVISSEAA